MLHCMLDAGLILLYLLEEKSKVSNAANVNIQLVEAVTVKDLHYRIEKEKHSKDFVNDKMVYIMKTL